MVGRTGLRLEQIELHLYAKETSSRHRGFILDFYGLDAVAHGSVISWQHINLLGEYDFSDERLQDNVGIRPPKLTP